MNLMAYRAFPGTFEHMCHLRIYYANHRRAQALLQPSLDDIDKLCSEADRLSEVVDGLDEYSKRFKLHVRRRRYWRCDFVLKLWNTSVSFAYIAPTIAERKRQPYPSLDDIDKLCSTVDRLSEFDVASVRSTWRHGSVSCMPADEVKHRSRACGFPEHSGAHAAVSDDVFEVSALHILAKRQP